MHASATLVLMVLLGFVLATATWSWVRLRDSPSVTVTTWSCRRRCCPAATPSNGTVAEAGGPPLAAAAAAAHGGHGGVESAHQKDPLELALLLIVGNVFLAVVMSLQLLATSAPLVAAFTSHMQQLLIVLSMLSASVVFAMNVAADAIGYTQALETPYVLSGLIFIFFLSKLFVCNAAPLCWTWLLLHTLYRYTISGLFSLLHASFGSPLFLVAMNTMLHVLAHDAEAKVRHGHWLRGVADQQRCQLRCVRLPASPTSRRLLPPRYGHRGAQHRLSAACHRAPSHRDCAVERSCAMSDPAASPPPVCARTSW